MGTLSSISSSMFDDAETTTELRKEQYKKIKEWILKIRKKLLSSGTNMEEDIEDKVTMMTVNNQNSKNSYKSERYNYNKNGSQRSNQGQRRGGQESSRNTITECAFCELIRNKDVTQVYLKRGKHTLLWCFLRTLDLLFPC